MVFWLGPATDGDLGPANPLQRICKEWVQKLGSDGATACVEIGDDQAGAKNRTDGPTPQGKGLLIREYEFPPSLPSQEPPSCGRSLILYIPSFGSFFPYTC